MPKPPSHATPISRCHHRRGATSAAVAAAVATITSVATRGPPPLPPIAAAPAPFLCGPGGSSPPRTRCTAACEMAGGGASNGISRREEVLTREQMVSVLGGLGVYTDCRLIRSSYFAYDNGITSCCNVNLHYDRPFYEPHTGRCFYPMSADKLNDPFDSWPYYESICDQIMSSPVRPLCYCSRVAPSPACRRRPHLGER